MAIVVMNRVNWSGTGYSVNLAEKPTYEYNDSLAAAGNGNSVLVPPDIQNISVGLMCNAASSGKVQYTLSPIAAVIAGTAEWLDWDNGTVSSSTSDVAFSCTAFRQVNVSGTTRLLLRAE